MSVDATGSNPNGGHYASASQTDERAVAFAEMTAVYREMAEVYDELADVYRAKAEGRSDAEIEREIQETVSALGDANAAAGKASGAFGGSPPAGLCSVASMLADIQMTIARLTSEESDQGSDLAPLRGGDRELTDREHIDLFKDVAAKAGNGEIAELIEEIFSGDRYEGLREFLKEGDNLEITKLLLTTPGLLQKAMAWAPDGWDSDGVPVDDPSTRREFVNWVVGERGALLSASTDMDDE